MNQKPAARLTIAGLGAAMLLFEIVLVGKFDPQETPVGFAVALVATGVAWRAASAAGRNYVLPASAAWLVLLVVRNVVRDTLIVFAVLLRQLMGGRVEDAFQNVPFDPGGDDPASAARRALTIAGVSTSPNAIALDIDTAHAQLRVHVLAVSNAPRHSREWPL